MSKAKKPTHNRRGAWRISRRTILGGAGAAVALPFLNVMSPPAGAKGQADKATRLLFVYVPNGMIRTNRVPAMEGAGYDLPSGLSALAGVKDQVSVLSGVYNSVGSASFTFPDGRESRDGAGDHARDVGTFLTCARLPKTTDESQVRAGISVDQVAANHLREFTPAVPSLVTSTRPGGGGGDSGYSPIYQTNISWTSATVQSERVTSPGAIFDRLFAGLDPDATSEQVERQKRLGQSVLDYVRDDAARLESRLGREDQLKLEEYLAGVRHLETRIESGGLGALCEPGTRPGDVDDFRERADLLYELFALGFQCDRTRVGTMMLIPPDRRYSFLSVSGQSIAGGHHDISHLPNRSSDPGSDDVAKISAINDWQLQSFATLVEKLQARSDVDGSTVLDNSLVLFGGGMCATGHQSGDTFGDLATRPLSAGGAPVHRHTNLPLFLAGSGGGMVTPGRHIIYRDREPLANLYISMLRTVGLETNSFGVEGTGPIGQILG